LKQSKIGITGGIGSGKSFVCKLLERIGYPVFYSDSEAKKIVTSDKEVRKSLTDLLGEEVFQDNQLNISFLANELFNSDLIRMKVNEIIHPKVQVTFDKWALERKSKLIFNEAAILFETGGYKRFDKTILVIAPLELKIERLLNRDKTDVKKIKDRMATQWTDEQKIPLADYVIHNDGSSLLMRIEEVINELLA
jgi:dephospho-CoA kinase